MTRRAAKARPASDGQASSADPGGQHDLRILNAIRQIIRATDIDSRKLAVEHHVTGPQLMCLMAAAEKGSVTAADIARRVHLSPSTLVGILDRLEAKGLLRRDRSDDDRRMVWIGITEAGRDLVSKAPFPLQYSLGRALGQLSEIERDQIARWMERLVKLMDADGIEPAPMLEIAAVRKHQVPGTRGHG